MLLRKVVLANIRVFNIVALPEKVKYLWDSLLLWFLIFSKTFCQFIILASFRSSENNMPNILIIWCCSLIIMFGSSCCRYSVLSVFIGNMVVFSKLMVAPVAKCNFWKNFKKFSANSWFARKKLESSAYCDSFMSFFFYLVFLFLVYLNLYLCLHSYFSLHYVYC